MAKKKPQVSVAAVQEQQQKHLKLEDVRVRLQSTEALVASSLRDARVMAAALIQDVTALYAPALPDEGARKRLDDARVWVAATDDGDKVADRGLAVLRAIVSDVARVAEDRDHGVALWRQRLRRFSGIEVVSASMAALFVLGFVFVQTSSGNKEKANEFSAIFNQASTRQNAGDHAGAVPLFEKAIAAFPDQDRTANAWNDLGWSLYNLERYDESIKAYKKALLIRPTFERARNNMEGAIRKAELKKSGAASGPTK